MEPQLSSGGDRVHPGVGPPGARSPRRGAAAALVAIAALACLVGLGRDLTSPDEARYAQIAEEIRSFEHGAAGLFLLHLNGDVYDQKPPLWFWLAALAGAPGGRVSEPAARIPSALAGIATVLLAMHLGSRLLGRRTGLVAGAVLLTTAQFAILAHRASLDALLTCFTTLALAAFCRWDQRPDRRAVAWLHGALGLAVLAKGPVGFLLPVLTIAVYLAWERRLRTLGKLAPPWALVLSLGPGLAWLAAATMLAPEGYFASAVGDNLFGRFFIGKHEAPFYYYVTQFPKQFLPWTLAWPVVWWMGRRHVFAPGGDPGAARAWRFLLAWVASTLLFFSLSSGKRGIYLLPAYPGAALLCADALVRWLGDRAALAPRTMARLGGAFALVGVAAGAIVGLDPAWTGFSLRPFGLAIVASALATAGALWLVGRRRLPFASTAALVWLFLAAAQASAFLWLQPAAEAQDSARAIAARAAAAARPGQPIGLFRERALLGGLGYYSRHRLEALPSQGALAALLERGETVLVVERRDLAEVEEVALLEVADRIPLGDEHFVVATARRRSPEVAGSPLVDPMVREAAR